MIFTSFTFSTKDVNAATENSSKTTLDKAAGPFDGVNCDDYALGVYNGVLAFTNLGQNEATKIYGYAFDDCMGNGGHSQYTVVVIGKSNTKKAD